MMRRIWSAFIFLGLVGCTCSASAKDLFNRLGVGYSNQFSTDLPGLAVRYYPREKVRVSTILGLDVRKDNAHFGFMGKISRILLKESHMNFYVGTGLAVVSQQMSSKDTKDPKNPKNPDMFSDTGVEIHGYIGGEFFLPKLENLGFSFEAGIAIISMSDQIRFKTIGHHPIKAGIIFYL